MQVYNVVAADAPRAGSAEAKRRATLRSTATGRCTPCRQRRGKESVFVGIGIPDHDAPRAGSAEAKVGLLAGATVSGPMHPVQAAHSEITTCRPMVL